MFFKNEPKLVRNEQAKLSATFFNNVGVASIIAGLIAPELAPTSLASVGRGYSLLVGGIGGVVFHYVGLFMLKDLRE